MRRKMAYWVCTGLLGLLVFSPYSACALNASGEIILSDSQKLATPATWNARLPKMVTDGNWSYAVFTRYTSETAGRIAWIYKKHKDWDYWQHASRQFNYVHQPPGLAMDMSGNLHLVFGCMPGYTCSSGGLSAGSSIRFYDVIFNQKNPDGSLDLSTFLNYNEWTQASYGYMGVGVNPASGTVYTSLATAANQGNKSGFNQTVFNMGSSPQFYPAPKARSDSNSLYPQLAISYSGSMYYSINELIPGWVNAAQYFETDLYRFESGTFTKVFSDSIPNPDGSNYWVFGADAAFDSQNRLYFVYHKRNGTAVTYFGDEPCSYLVIQNESGGFDPPKEVGCYSNYVQLQVDSKGNIYLLEPYLTTLVLMKSSDGGNNWTRYDVGVPYLLPNTGYLPYPTIVKPWNSPDGYNPDVIYGVFSGSEPGTWLSFYMASFSIDLSEISGEGCASQPGICNDGNECTYDSCNESTGMCSNVPVADGTPCYAGQYCTLNSMCSAGECKGMARDCDDGIACTNDSCDENADSCSNVPINSLCDDGLFCNGAEMCNALSGCQAGTPVACNDNNTCTADSCSENLDKCEYAWPSCGLSDGCCCPACKGALGDLNYDPDCTPAIKCWSAQYQYLYANSNQARKFCKCAMGTYGYSTYKYAFKRATAYYYSDSLNNSKWKVASRSSYSPVYQVTCKDGKAYPTNKDYYAW